MKQICPECEGEGFVRHYNAVADCHLAAVCPKCGGCRWIDSWRKCSEELPPCDPECKDYSNWILLAIYEKNKSGKSYIGYYAAKLIMPLNKFYVPHLRNLLDPNKFLIYWQPIEPPEEE